MKRSGFSIVESMVYCVVALFLLQRLIPWTINVVKVATAASRESQYISDCLIAHTIFNKDIYDTFNPLHCWFECTSDALLWEVDNQTFIQWFYKGQRLYRRTGVYNKVTNQWHKKHTDLLLDNVTNAFFEHKQQHYTSPIITLHIFISKNHYFFTGTSRYANH